jgi:hypothetical protein
VKRTLLAIVTAGVLLGATAAAAFADSPFAGNSGHFRGSAQPCQSGNNPHCPPFGP